MGSITTGVGLISGINTAQLIEQLLAIEARPKRNLESRVSVLEAQRTALLDINARLLNLKNASSSFRLDRIFQSVQSLSSNEEVLTASVGKGTQPGSYSFIVKQLVQNNQLLSGGFADRETTPLGLDALSFEFGNGRLSVDRALEDLNGGTGVDRGRITITDRSGASATIDLTDVTSVNEVLDRINDASGVAVTATVTGDGFVITDTSGGGGSLTIANKAGDTTATDLGIAGTDAGGVITGSSIFFISGSTSLASLNDGNGVAIREGVHDLFIQAQGPDPGNPPPGGPANRAFLIDLGPLRSDIDDATAIDDLNNGDGITIDDDGDEPDLKITDRDGVEHEVDLTGVTTVGQLRTRISTETGGAVTLAVVDGDHFELSDTTGGGGLFRVQGAGPNGDDAAEDLGLLNDAGVSANTIVGSTILNTINTPATQTIQDVIDRINNAEDNLGAVNGGHIVASIGADGKSLVITDTVDGPQNLLIRAGAGLNPWEGGSGGAAADLGIITAQSGSNPTTFQGSQIVGSLNSILVNNLNGGAGLNGATTITVTDRNGASFTLNNLDTHDTLQEIVDAINAEAVAQSVDVNVALNANGTGLQVTDTSGGVGNLILQGDASTALDIETDPAGVAENSVTGSNLQRRYVDEATLLSDLNYGRGIGFGSFRITDGFGDTATITINDNIKTVDKLLQTINGPGLAIKARINDNGDGIIIEEDLSAATSDPFVKIKVATINGGSAAALGILGEATTVDGGFIDGSYEKVVDLDTNDDLNEVVSKINDAGLPVNAAIINTGSGINPFRISFSSEIGGLGGDLIIDSGSLDLGLTTLVKAQDAKVFFGSQNPEDAFLITRNSNTIDDVVEGLTLNLLEVSDTAVTVKVSRDDQAIVDKVLEFTAAFNDAVDRIDQYDFFDLDSEERGVLLSNPTTSRVRAALFRTLREPAQGIDTQFTLLSQIGFSVGSEGELQFNEDTFRAALEDDPTAVENLFAAFKATTETEEEIAPGVTVTTDTQTFSKLGIGDVFDTLLDDLTNTIDGTMTLADNALGDQIKLFNDRIERFDEQLDVKRARLQAEFSAMELALARLQNQGNALASIASNVSLASSAF